MRTGGPDATLCLELGPSLLKSSNLWIWAGWAPKSTWWACPVWPSRSGMKSGKVYRLQSTPSAKCYWSWGRFRALNWTYTYIHTYIYILYIYTYYIIYIYVSIYTLSRVSCSRPPSLHMVLGVSPPPPSPPHPPTPHWPPNAGACIYIYM